jgi:hypothetical protein
VLSAALPVTYPLLPVSRCKRLLSLINTVLNSFKNLAVIFKGGKRAENKPREEPLLQQNLAGIFKGEKRAENPD